jgi:hypothetical protein
MDEPRIESWRRTQARDIALVGRRGRDGEAFGLLLTAELERVVEYGRRVRVLLTARYEVDADTAMRWLAEAKDDERRIVDLLARLDELTSER